MVIDIVLKGLVINENGLAAPWDTGNEGLPGIITLSWIHCRPDLLQNALIWTHEIDNIKRKTSITVSPDWYKTLAFRQSALGKSILKIEIITTKTPTLATKIVNGILGLGLQTVGGLILNPVASSIYKTLTSALDLDESTVYQVGSALIDIDPDTIEFKDHEIKVGLEQKKVIIRGVDHTIPSQRVKEYAIPKGNNGFITLGFSEFKPDPKG